MYNLKTNYTVIFCWKSSFYDAKNIYSNIYCSQVSVLNVEAVH